MNTVKKAVLASLVVAASVAGTSSLAVAGEITGNGKSLKNDDNSLNGASVCAFSGLNDTYSGDPSVPDAQGFYRTQNWGSLSPEVRAFLTSIGDNPGKSCKPGAETGE